MKMHSTSVAAAIILATGFPASGGVVTDGARLMTTATDAFAKVRRPITNPTLFDLALPGTNLHPIVMYQRLPDHVETTIGRVPMGGDVQVYALQFEIALNERLSFVATKDGYVVIDPDTKPLWSDASGFANLGAGLKYAFYLDPVSETVASATMTFEFPTGNREVFQGEGDGAVNLILSGLKLWGDFQLAGAAGIHLPLDGQMSTTSFVSAHASHEVCSWFIPLAEVSWYHVIDAGSGRPAFRSQAGGAVPPVATFEGGDLLNFGAANASQNRDQVTLGLGFRSRIGKHVEAGFAYEIPLTDKNKGIMEDRCTLDLVWKF